MLGTWNSWWCLVKMIGESEAQQKCPHEIVDVPYWIYHGSHPFLFFLGGTEW